MNIIQMKKKSQEQNYYNNKNRKANVCRKKKTKNIKTFVL